MLEWIQSHEPLMWWTAAVSAVMFVGSLIAIPILIIRLPVDYFTSPKRHPAPWKESHPVLRLVVLIVKNISGAVLVLAGIAMLLLPGQGLVSILIGVVLLDFPKKYALQRWIIRRKQVHRAINWIRRKGDRKPLEVPDASD